jgi:hypothetical protein
MRHRHAAAVSAAPSTECDISRAMPAWLALQQNMDGAREVFRWTPPGGAVSPEQAYALARDLNLRPVEAARLLGAVERLSQLAGAVQDALQSNDPAAIREARKQYEDALTRVILASRGLDATSLTGRPGALDRAQDSSGAPISTPTQRGQVPTQVAPSPTDPATPARVAEILRTLPPQSYPNARVEIVDNRIVRMTYTSQNATRTLLVGSFSDLERLNPDIARQAGPFLTQRSALYQGRTAEYAGTSFRMADLTSVVLDDKGDVIGTGTLTYQTAAFGDRRVDQGGDVQIDNLRMRPVLFLAQVAGEKSGGRQAVDPLLAIGRETRTNVVATTFPVNFWGANDKAGLYGPAPGTNPDFGVLWRVRGDYPVGQPYFFSPDQGSPVGADGRSIFARLPREPDPANAEDVRTHDRIYYGWVNDDVNGDGRRSNADIPLFFYGDHRLGDQVPGRNTAQSTRSYWVPMPSTDGNRSSVLLPPPSNLPQIRSASDLQGGTPADAGTSAGTGSINPFQPPALNLLPGTEATQPEFSGSRVPPDIDQLVPPGSLTPTVDALPPEEQQQAAQLSQQQGNVFLQRLQDGRLAVSRYVNDTWQPIASFGSDIVTGAQQAYQELPAPVRTAIRTSGLVLGVAADPLGAVFGSAVNGFQRALQTPALRPVVNLMQQASERGAQTWVQMQQNPVGRHIVGLWENTFGHPQFGQVASVMTTGAGRVFQAVSNGGLGLLAAGAVTGETKIGSFVAGDPRQMPPELAQIYRQVAIVPRGMTIHYATVPIPGTPEGRVTLWTAGGSGMLMFPGLFEPGRTSPTAARNPVNGEVNLWASTVLSGPTAYGGLAVNLTPNIGIQRSAFVSLGSALVQTPVVRVGATGSDALIPGRTTPWLDPKIIGSVQPIRVAFTDTVNFPVVIGDQTLPFAAQINRVRTPVAGNIAGTVINPDRGGSMGVNPDLQVDFSRPTVVRNQTVVGLAPGGVPQANDLQQLMQIFGLEEAPNAPDAQSPRQDPGR